MAEPGPAMWSRFKVSAGSDIWAYSFARKFGFETVAIGRGGDKKNLALKLGARTYIDTALQDVTKELLALGGARVIVATAPDGKAMGGLIDGLGVNGKLVVIGASAEPFAVSSLQFCWLVSRSWAGRRNFNGFGGHPEIRGR